MAPLSANTETRKYLDVKGLETDIDAPVIYAIASVKSRLDPSMDWAICIVQLALAERVIDRVS